MHSIFKMEISFQEKNLSAFLGKCRIFNQPPVYSGNVTLVVRDNNCQHRLSVFMKLYENCPRHNAVLYRDQDCTFQYGVLNYRNCTVRRIDDNCCQFDISSTQKGAG